MKISIIGLGYIGLPTAAILASKGNDVVGVDIDEKIVNRLNNGDVHIVEPELDIIVRATVSSGNLRTSTVPESSEVFVITVPTPIKDDLTPDISCVENATKSISPMLKRGDLVIIESTVPVGTVNKVAKWLSKARTDLCFPIDNCNEKDINIHLAYCPERVLPGHVFRELVENDRVIGGATSKCAEKAKNFYKTFVDGHCMLTDSRTAEMCKLTENAYRDVNIAFANELSNVCDTLGVNVRNLIKFANRHPRVNILQPGPGVGGHCIAVDPWFIISSTPEQAKLMRVARDVNDSMPENVIKKVKKVVGLLGKDISKLSIASFGLSFKADIDDLRSSPAIEIAKNISRMPFKKHYIVEPNQESLPDCLKTDNNIFAEIEESILAVDIIVLLVDHKEFKEVDLQLLKGKQIIDTRGVWQ